MSADVTREQQGGGSYYTVRVAIPESEFDRLAPLRVAAGMNADVYLQTGGRTPFSYSSSPSPISFARAFRERLSETATCPESARHRRVLLGGGRIWKGFTRYNSRAAQLQPIRRR